MDNDIETHLAAIETNQKWNERWRKAMHFAIQSFIVSSIILMCSSIAIYMCQKTGNEAGAHLCIFLNGIFVGLVLTSLWVIMRLISMRKSQEQREANAYLMEVV